MTINLPQKKHNFTLYLLECCPFCEYTEKMLSEKGVTIFDGTGKSLDEIEKIVNEIPDDQAVAIKYNVTGDNKQEIIEKITPLLPEDDRILFPIIFQKGILLGGFGDLKAVYIEPF